MEDSCEVESEGNKALQDNNKKRTVKSRNQVEALESLYDEHKYPTELMKSQLAESLGLTEKQVSGWFCHRRLKDKRQGEACISGRQDRSSSVIQDHGSGLMQDSCGSTKQGDNVHFDPREVESRRLTAPDFLVANPHYDLSTPYAENNSGMDDTCSGSSSPTRDRLPPENEFSFNSEIPRSITQNESVVLINAKVMKARNGPSGYLKVKGHVENAAITAVKKQLGRHYREGGPPLGVEFEPLPPGAFESSIRSPVYKPSCTDDSLIQNSAAVSGVHRQLNRETRYELYNPEFNSSELDLQGSEYHENCSIPQHKQKSFIPNQANFFLRQKLSREMIEDSAGEGPAHDCEHDYEMGAKHHFDRMRFDSTSSNLLPCTVRVGEHNKFSLHGHNMSPPKVARREYLETNPSDPVFKRGGILDTDDRGRSRLVTKNDVDEVKYYGEKRTTNEHRGLSRVKAYPSNEKKVSKRVGGEFQQQQSVKKPSIAETPPWMNQAKRLVSEMPSSFSEDETAETDSSME